MDERHSSAFETTEELVLRSDVSGWMRQDTCLLKRILYDSFPSFCTLDEAVSLSSAFSDGERMMDDHVDLVLAALSSRLGARRERKRLSLTLKPRSEGGGGGWFGRGRGGWKRGGEDELGGISFRLVYPAGGRFKDPL